MTAAIDWRWEPIEALSPWTGGNHAIAWIGRLPGPSLPPNATDHADARGLPARARPDFLRRRLALRHCVARWIGLPSEAVVIACDAFRRPIVDRPGGGLTVSSASREGILAVGLACHPLGIDLEVASGTAEALALAALTPAETRTLAALPAGAREAAFLTLWTAKEAYLKAIGLGLARDPALIGVDVCASGQFGVSDAGRPIALRAAETIDRAIDGRMVRAACVVLP